MAGATLLAIGCGVLVAGCGAGASSSPPAVDTAAVTAEITAMLDASAQSWNRADLDGFLDDYMSGDSTTFSGAAGVRRGIDRIRESYVRGYFSTGRPQHDLAFSEIEVRPLGASHALALGRYTLTEPETGDVASTGYFSLVLARTDQGWKIIHDHSSESR